MSDELDDEILFADEDDEYENTSIDCWKVLIVDDEEQVHSVTHLVLDKMSFQGKPIKMISAHSGKEAREIITEDDDIALILLDVVMETDHAGLDVVKYIRNELQNHYVRIVLRTGQPGQAPEREVIESYDINDYKEKTELTSGKLFTLTYSGLRSYNDIMDIARSKRGLEHILAGSRELFLVKSNKALAVRAIMQSKELLEIEAGKRDYTCYFVEKRGEEYHMMTVNDKAQEEKSFESIAKNIQLAITDAFSQEKTCYGEKYVAFFCPAGNQHNYVLMLHADSSIALSDMSKNIIEVFSANLGLALENVFLHIEVEETAREIVYRLGEAVETRSKETGNHVKRVALMSELLALLVGLPQEEAELIKNASPMHDLGKIGIPDAILNKPGRLDADEWTVMQSHAVIGYEILKQSKRDVLRKAATIAHEHHERWDGAGYPRGIEGDEISIEGRITSVADVFDALASERCYKPAWPLEKVVDFFEKQIGKSFDPKLVKLLLDNLDDFIAIRDRFKD